MTTAEIARFNPTQHDLAAFRCEVEEVDAFFSARPREHNFRFIWEQRVGDIYVALEGGEIVGVIAYAASHLSSEVAEVVIGDFRRAGRGGREKPLERGGIPAVRIVILGVREDCRRRRIGTDLVNHALSAITAPVYYLIPQRGSEGFYESLGFVRKPAGIRTMMIKIPPALKLPPR